MDRGVVYVSIGDNAAVETRLAIEALRNHHRDWPVVVAGDRKIDGGKWIDFPDQKNGRPGRWAKVNLNNLSPFGYTLFMDADTRVYDSVEIGFRLLQSGWDMVMVPSQPQGRRLLWHCSDEERIATLIDVSVEPLQLNTGVMWFRSSTRLDRFFVEWRRQWLLYRDVDQGAFLRALHRRPLAIFVLGQPYNGGAVVGHRFGAAA